MIPFSNFESMIPLSDESFNAITAIMETFLILNGTLKKALREVLFEVTIKKGTYILTAGAKQPYLWFILDGLLREMVVDPYSLEAQTSWFWFKSEFVYAMPGFFDQAPVTVSMEVVRDTKLILLSYEHCRNLRSRFDQADLLLESIRSRHGVGRKNHLKEIHTTDTVSRYLKYEKQLSVLFQHVKLKYIAEYMGMSIDTLGKLHRKHIKKQLV